MSESPQTLPYKMVLEYALLLFKKDVADLPVSFSKCMQLFLHETLNQNFADERNDFTDIPEPFLIQNDAVPGKGDGVKVFRRYIFGNVIASSETESLDEPLFSPRLRPALAATGDTPPNQVQKLSLEMYMRLNNIQALIDVLPGLPSTYGMGMRLDSGMSSQVQSPPHRQTETIYSLAGVQCCLVTLKSAMIETICFRANFFVKPLLGLLENLTLDKEVTIADRLQPVIRMLEKQISRAKEGLQDHLFALVHQGFKDTILHDLEHMVFSNNITPRAMTKRLACHLYDTAQYFAQYFNDPSFLAGVQAILATLRIMTLSVPRMLMEFHLSCIGIPVSYSGLDSMLLVKALSDLIFRQYDPKLFVSKRVSDMFVASGLYILSETLYDCLARDQLIQTRGLFFGVGNSISGLELATWLLSKANACAKEVVFPPRLDNSKRKFVVFDVATKAQNLKSLGIMVRDNLCVSVAPMSPAQRAGLETNDLLVSVDHKPLTDLSRNDAIELLDQCLGADVSEVTIEVADASTAPPPWIFFQDKQAEIVGAILVAHGHLRRAKGDQTFVADSSRYQFVYLHPTTKQKLFVSADDDSGEFTEPFEPPELADPPIASSLKRQLILGVVSKLPQHEAGFDSAQRFFKELTVLMAK